MNSLPKLRDLMDTDFVVLSPEMSVSEAIGILLDHGITGAAVLDEQRHVLGLLSERDCLQTLLRGAYEGMPSGRVADYMMTEVFTVSPDTDLFELAELFVKQESRRFLVVENGVMVGQITRRDLLRAINKYSK